MSFARLKVRRKFFTGLFAFPKLFPPPHRLSNRTQQKGPLHVSKESLLTSYLITEQARFYRLAYSYLKNREEALDAVQTAVCRAWEQQDRLREPEAVRTWFYRILIHVCTDMPRQRKRVTFVPPDALDAGSYEDPLPLDGDLATRVDALPPEIATIIRLRFYEELSLKEISAATGAPLSTVKTRLYAGLKKLRVSMEGYYHE